MPAPGKWSIRQIVAHLADSEMVGAHRFRQMIAEDNPTLIAFDQDAWARNLDYARRKPKQSLESFRRMRARKLRAAERSARGQPTPAPAIIASAVLSRSSPSWSCWRAARRKPRPPDAGHSRRVQEGEGQEMMSSIDAGRRHCSATVGWPARRMAAAGGAMCNIWRTTNWRAATPAAPAIARPPLMWPLSSNAPV